MAPAPFLCCSPNALRGTYPLIDYIQSRDALKELNQANFILDAYSTHGDFVSHFRRSFDDSFERYGGTTITTLSR
ncbi:capsule polysaccharide export protein KpsE/RkpR [Paraburkholderia sp. UCT70]